MAGMAAVSSIVRAESDVDIFDEKEKEAKKKKEETKKKEEKKEEKKKKKDKKKDKMPDPDKWLLHKSRIVFRR